MQKETPERFVSIVDDDASLRRSRSLKIRKDRVMAPAQ